MLYCPMLLLAVIDQAPLRASAAAECTAARRRLEEARAAWHRFEHEDKPAFARWRAREFGPLLSRAREVEVQIAEAQALIHEVEMEMRRFFQDAASAYQRVLFRRAHPGETPPETAAAAAPADGGEGRRLSEFEQEALFQEWVQRSLGTNPDKMDDDAYEASFATFKTHMFQARPPAPPPSARRVERPPELPEEEPVEELVDQRVKELYRLLVRRLHPDLRADGEVAVSSLWHEVQEAYLAADVARMELLLALSDLESDQVSAQTSVGQMRALLAELERAVWALEKSVEEAEGEDAWNFARQGPSDDLRARVGWQLKSDFAARSQRLELLTRTIASWTPSPATRRQVAGKYPAARHVSR